MSWFLGCFSSELDNMREKGLKIKKKIENCEKKIENYKKDKNKTSDKIKKIEIDNKIEDLEDKIRDLDKKGREWSLHFREIKSKCTRKGGNKNKQIRQRKTIKTRRRRSITPLHI